MCWDFKLSGACADQEHIGGYIGEMLMEKKLETTILGLYTV